MNNISPIDGRYHNITNVLSQYFSEFSFFKYRLYVELKYFIELIDTLPELDELKTDIVNDYIINIWKNFNKDDYLKIKKLEETVQHDIKALEYFIRDKFIEIDNTANVKLNSYISFIHFGITSQDINTSANILSLKDSLYHELLPIMCELIDTIIQITKNEKGNDIMVGFTHGQPAVPTSMSKELSVFSYRLQQQVDILRKMPFTTKFGGAVGNMNAHYAAYPNIDWVLFADNFINKLGLSRELYTTQISNYDNLCNIFNVIKTINNIINDLNIDCWLYISKGYLKLKRVVNEVGSSTMPQKVNPIHFENSEGNICIANSLIEGITRKVSVSRLQRDLTDSTILRNIGSVISYTLISYKATLRGLSKISIDKEIINQELCCNLSILSEGIQTILRKHKIPNAYEYLHKLTRENTLTHKLLQEFIETMPKEVQPELNNLSLTNYIGTLSTL
jgi:adenylosuccinate lyase